MINLIPAPLAGDPHGLARWAARYKVTAQNLKKAADDLRDLTDDESFVSLAVDEVRLKALEARTATESIYVRYDGAADAFATYATELEAAQARANRAIAAFHNADGPGRRAEAHRDRLEEQTKADGGQTPSLLEEFLEAKRRAESLIAHASSALSEYHAAVQDQRDAADRAARALDKAGDKSGLNDNFFEAIGGKFQQAYELAQKYLAPLIAQLHEVLKVVNDILSKVALALTVAAIFFPALAPLAAFVSAVSLGMSAVMLLCSLALFCLGKGSLGAVLGDAISVVASKFGGKLASGAAGGILSKVGAGVAPAFSSANSLLAPTLASQVKFVVAYGATNSQLIHAGSEMAVDFVGDHASDLAGGSSLMTSGWDMAPSAAGPSWNAPPTIQVPPVFSSTDHVQTVLSENVSGALGSQLCVGATGA